MERPQEEYVHTMDVRSYDDFLSCDIGASVFIVFRVRL